MVSLIMIHNGNHNETCPFLTGSSQEIDLSSVLQELGITSIFDARKVDFSVSHLTYNESLFMTHKI